MAKYKYAVLRQNIRPSGLGFPARDRQKSIFGTNRIIQIASTDYRRIWYLVFPSTG